MKSYNRSILALTLGLMTILGAATAANARWGGHGGGHGYGYGAQAPSPEAQKIMDECYNRIAPQMLELRAKQDELTAKIYSGADAKTIDALSQEVTRLQARVTQERVAMQQQFAKAGIPMHHGAMHGGRGACGYGGGMHRGWHGGYGQAPQAE